MLKKIKEKVISNQQQGFSRVDIYKNKSLFFEYIVKGEVLVISYNIKQNKIYFYFRGGGDIRAYSHFFKNIGFSLNDRSLICDTRNMSESDIFTLLLTTLNRTEEILFSRSICIRQNRPDYKIAVDGFYLDNKNNHVITSKIAAMGPTVQFFGENNYLRVLSDCNLKNLSIIFQGDYSRVIINEGVEVSGTIIVRNSSQVIVGKSYKEHREDIVLYKDFNSIVNFNG